MYVDNFPLTLNTIVILKTLKKCLAKKYDIKNLEELKIIIRWQISQDITLGTIKSQSISIYQGLDD